MNILPKRVHGRQLLADRQGVDANPVRGDEGIAANIERIRTAFERLHAGVDILRFPDFEPERLKAELGRRRQNRIHFQRDVRAVDIAEDSHSLQAGDNFAQQLKPILVGLARERTVYLGAAPPGMEDQRRKLAQELSDRKYRIVSAEQDSSTDVADERIRELLRGCGRCVHFTDARTPSSQSQGAIYRRIQSELRISAEMKVRRIVSAQDAAVAGQSSTSLEHVPDADSSPEQLELLVNKTTQELKETVLGQLKDVASGDTGEDGPVLVYLICDRGDHPWLVAYGQN